MVLRFAKLKVFRIDRREQESVLDFVKRQTLGLVCVLVGAFLAIPGVPGPGFVFFILAFLLLEFPGKRKLLLSLQNKHWFRVARVVARKRMNILLILPRVGNV